MIKKTKKSYYSFSVEFFLFNLFFLFSLLLNAQEAAVSTPQESYLQENISTQKLDKKKWEDITSDLDYSGIPVELEEQKDTTDQFGDQEIVRRRQTSSGGNLFGAGFFKGFAIVFLIAIGVIIIYFLVNQGLSPDNDKVKPTAITLENIEDNIHETDLERFIREAKEKGDFALAMRLHYLAIIKELSLKKIIKWKRDKTNGEYLRELSSSPYFADFNEVTNIFERVWYGGGTIDRETFAAVEEKFITLTHSIQKS